MKRLIPALMPFSPTITSGPGLVRALIGACAVR